jgi:hypothetical protein
VFDLPAVAGLEPLSRLGSVGRCQVVGGFLFVGLVGADAYLMRHIIHDWEDNEAIAILRNCREAMNPDSLGPVVETVIPPGTKRVW